ncbi:MAG: molybdate ABC transporter permease subunit [Thermoflexales bacterium]|nr:molybdate ABC transporter permease subunit [Thermoflexales bacterium]MCS7324790.1 molybdate ABC transporter permease subunit [Thermoflexales bacterium]MCX7938548.1 molybdate ABC transporter permease subunit [Thermoflexales bacterium]MDW8053114.1 molybdate ABC transporter permease subunit [Anaerolineae bacterium]MDW8291767.1 molybdate ABC transporter permease subunit [Anaerolineae bacterium]
MSIIESPLTLSLWVSVLASVSALLLGLALAWLFARHNWRGKWLFEGLVALPLVLPPTVLGYYLLLVFGRRGLGSLIEQISGIAIAFNWPGAVIAAGVSALPLVVQTVKPALLSTAQEIEDAARVDGCNEWSVFWLVTFPLIRAAVVGGWLLAFLRALGEFGATMMIAGNIPGRTQTLSMAVYDAVLSGNFELAGQLVLLLSVITFALLFVALLLSERQRNLHG